MIDWYEWSRKAKELTSHFYVAVDANQRDEEFAAAWEMVAFLEETVTAFGTGKYDNPTGEFGYEGSEGPDKEGWDD